MSDREYMRAVTNDREDIHFALQWAQGVLRQWFSTHGEAALIVSEPRRTLSQNDKMWPMLEDLARQVDWPVDGVMQKLDREDWKHIMSAGLRNHQRVAAGKDGGFVVLGQSTKRLTKSEFSDLIEIIYEFGSTRGVVWSEPAKKTIDEHKKRRAA